MSDDVFQARIDEINREMSELLEKNSKRKDELQKEGAFILPTHASSPRYTPLISTSTDVVSREVQQCVQREMKFYEDHVRSVVNQQWDERVAELDNLLRSRFAELKMANDSVGKLVVDVAKELSAVRRELHTAVQQVQDHVQEKVVGLQRDLLTKERALRREMNDIKVQLDEVSRSSREESVEFQMRIENALKRSQEKWGKLAGGFDEQLQAARAELAEMLRSTSKKSNGEFDQLERHLSHLHASIGQSEKALGRVTVQVSQLLEDNATHHSELRALRGDADRLEVLLAQKVDRGTTLPSSTAGAPVSLEDTIKLHQDVFALKQSVAYLGDLLETKKQFVLPGGTAVDTRAALPTERPRRKPIHEARTRDGADRAVMGCGPVALDEAIPSRGENSERSRSLSSSHHMDPTQPTHVKSPLAAKMQTAPPSQSEDNSYVGSDADAPLGPRDFGGDTSEEENSKLARSALD